MYISLVIILRVLVLISGVCKIYMLVVQGNDPITSSVKLYSIIIGNIYH